MTTTNVTPGSQPTIRADQKLSQSSAEQKGKLGRPSVAAQSSSSTPKLKFSPRDVKFHFGASDIDPSSCVQKNPAFEYVFRPKQGGFEGFFPRRETSLIGGSSGSGKTTLVLDMANQLRQGFSFLEHPACQQPFSYVSLERSKEGFERTCRRMGFDPHWFNFYRPTGENRKLPLPELIAGLLGTPEHQASKIFFVEGMDIRLDDDGKHRTMNDPLAVAQLMGQLDDLEKQHGLTVIGTVGMPKMKPGEKYSGRDQLIGSTFWARHAETILTTVANTDDGGPKSCTLQAWLRNGQDEEYTLTWQNGRLVVTEPPSKKTPADQIIEWLEKNRKPGEQFSIDNLVSGLAKIKPPIARTTIQTIVADERGPNSLLRSGVIEKVSRGIYRWKGKVDILEAKRQAEQKARETDREWENVTKPKILAMFAEWQVGEKHPYNFDVKGAAQKHGLTDGGESLEHNLGRAVREGLIGNIGGSWGDYWRLK